VSLRRLVAAAVAAVCLAPAALFAQSQEAPRGILRGVGIDQKLGSEIPLDLAFRDENGRAVHLGDYFGKRPVILVLVYFHCPMLCSYVEQGTVRALRGISFTAGRQFEVVTVSFDPADTPELALVNKKENLRQYGRPGSESGWHVLTGAPASISQLTRAVGFRYALDRETGEYAHAAGIIVATPQGRLARYLYGVDYSPTDLRLALVEASHNAIGNPVDQILLYCCRYDPMTGKYGLVIMNVLRLGGALTVLGLGGFMAVMIRRDRNRKIRAVAGPTEGRS
jgi:protein SCO1